MIHQATKLDTIRNKRHQNITKKEKKRKEKIQKHIWFKLQTQGHKGENVTPWHCEEARVFMNIKVKEEMEHLVFGVVKFRQKQSEEFIIMKKIITHMKLRIWSTWCYKKLKRSFENELYS